MVLLNGILVIFGWISFSFTEARVLNDNEKIEAINMHNLVRRSVYPPASNMRELDYSDDLAMIASKYLEKCTFTHLYHSAGYGENGRLADDFNITRTVMNWYQERVYYNWDKPYGERCYLRDESKNYLSQPQCGHYRMITTYTLTKFGCAVNFCPEAKVPNGSSYKSAYLTFCFYDKGPRDHPYTAGETCTGCDNFGNRFCRNGLCVKGESGTCLIKCQRCQKYPTFIPNYCGCDCDAGNGNDCSEEESSRPTPKTCKTCDSLTTPCQNGGTDVSTSSIDCKCECPEEYSGKFCEVSPDVKEHLSNCTVITKFGEIWMFGLRYPVDRFKFLKKWNDQTREKIASRIRKVCGNKCGKIGQNVSSDDVQLVAGYPQNNEEGSLIIKVFVKKDGEYIPRGTVRRVLLEETIKDSHFLI